MRLQRAVGVGGNVDQVPLLVKRYLFNKIANLFCELSLPVAECIQQTA